MTHNFLRICRGREVGQSVALYSPTSSQRCFLNSRLYHSPAGQLVPPFVAKDVRGHWGCVNAVEFSSGCETMLASGGDDRRVLVWKIADLLKSGAAPASYEVMHSEHDSNIFCVAFDRNNETILSSGNDHQVIVHDIATKEPKTVYLLNKACYGLSMHPECASIFVTATEDGDLSIFDLRAPSSQEPVSLASDRAPFHAVAYNPVEPQLVASASAKEGVQLWDVRKPQWSLLQFGSHSCQQSAMSVRWQAQGRRLLALRRKLEPVLYDGLDGRTLALFDAEEGYYNACTMKTCSFAGIDDEFVVAGSDDFRLYMWRLPNIQSGEQETPHRVRVPFAILAGHRCIVNQVRFSRVNHLLVSSGVEKVIKLWSPWNLEGATTHPISRPLYTQKEYLNMILSTGQSVPHDYSTRSEDEDRKMMAFFDSLVQRELCDSSDDDESYLDRNSTEFVYDILRPSTNSYNDTIDSSSSSSEVSLASDPDDDQTEYRSSSPPIVFGRGTSNVTSILRRAFLRGDSTSASNQRTNSGLLATRSPLTSLSSSDSSGDEAMDSRSAWSDHTPSYSSRGESTASRHLRADADRRYSEPTGCLDAVSVEVLVHGNQSRGDNVLPLDTTSSIVDNSTGVVAFPSKSSEAEAGALTVSGNGSCDILETSDNEAVSNSTSAGPLVASDSSASISPCVKKPQPATLTNSNWPNSDSVTNAPESDWNSRLNNVCIIQRNGTTSTSLTSAIIDHNMSYLATAGSRTQSRTCVSSSGILDIRRNDGRRNNYPSNQSDPGTGFDSNVNSAMTSSSKSGTIAAADRIPPLSDLSPDLGYLPNQPSAVRSVTALVMRKRSENRRQKRFEHKVDEIRRRKRLQLQRRRAQLTSFLAERRRRRGLTSGVASGSSGATNNSSTVSTSIGRICFGSPPESIVATPLERQKLDRRASLFRRIRMRTHLDLESSEDEDELISAHRTAKISLDIPNTPSSPNHPGLLPSATEFSSESDRIGFGSNGSRSNNKRTNGDSTISFNSSGYSDLLELETSGLISCDSDTNGSNGCNLSYTNSVKSELTKHKIGENDNWRLKHTDLDYCYDSAVNSLDNISNDETDSSLSDGGRTSDDSETRLLRGSEENSAKSRTSGESDLVANSVESSLTNSSSEVCERRRIKFVPSGKRRYNLMSSARNPDFSPGLSNCDDDDAFVDVDLKKQKVDHEGTRKFDKDTPTCTITCSNSTATPGSGDSNDQTEDGLELSADARNCCKLNSNDVSITPDCASMTDPRNSLLEIASSSLSSGFIESNPIDVKMESARMSWKYFKNSGKSKHNKLQARKYRKKDASDD